MKNSACIVFAAALLSACSPSAYDHEIATFNNGVTSLVTTHDIGALTIDRHIAAEQQSKLVDDRDRLALLPGCNTVDPNESTHELPPCAVVPFGTETAPPPSSLQSKMAKDAPLFAALQNYAAALAAVADAKDDESLSASTQTLATAASGLGTATGELSAEEGGTVKSAGGLFGEGLSVYLSSRRYSALRAAVSRVDPSIKTLGRTVEADLSAIRARQVLWLEKDLHYGVLPLGTDSVGKMSKHDYETKLAALQSKVSLFNQLRTLDPKAAASAMIEAHHVLATALQNDSGQAVPIMAEMTRFSNAAAQLKTTLDTENAE